MQESRRSRTQEIPAHRLQIGRAQRGSQRQKLKSWSLHGSVLGLMNNICYGCELCVCLGPLTVGREDLLIPFLGTSFRRLVASASFDMKICA